MYCFQPHLKHVTGTLYYLGKFKVHIYGEFKKMQLKHNMFIGHGVCLLLALLTLQINELSN